jgi:hypothetical protein
MAVHGDGLARRQNLYEKGLVPPDWPSIRETTGFDAMMPLDEAGAMHAVREVIPILISGYRFCVLCNSDLSDRGAPKSTSREGFKAATGQYPEWTLSIPQGGHAPDCAVAYLLRWLGFTGHAIARLRTFDVDDAQAQLLVKAKEPMELVATDVSLLTEAEREARAKVLAGFGLTESEADQRE